MEARTTGRVTTSYGMFLSLVQFAYSSQPMKPHHFRPKRDVIGLKRRMRTHLGASNMNMGNGTREGSIHFSVRACFKAGLIHEVWQILKHG
jgi:hypothetical protein